MRFWRTVCIKTMKRGNTSNAATYKSDIAEIDNGIVDDIMNCAIEPDNTKVFAHDMVGDAEISDITLDGVERIKPVDGVHKADVTFASCGPFDSNKSAIFGTVENNSMPALASLPTDNGATQSTMEDETTVRKITIEDVGLYIEPEDGVYCDSYTENDEKTYIETVKEYIVYDRDIDNRNYCYSQYQRDSLFIKINTNTLCRFIGRITAPQFYRTRIDLEKCTEKLFQEMSQAVYNIIYGNQALALRHLQKIGKLFAHIISTLSKVSSIYVRTKPVMRVIGIYDDLVDKYDSKFI